MTKEQKADALLCAARCWQNRMIRQDGMGEIDLCATDYIGCSPDMEDMWWDESFAVWADVCASLAMSEASALLDSDDDIVDAETGQ